MEEGIPTLAVGFEISMADAFGQLRQLDDILGDTAMAAVREFKRMEAASKGALDVAGATASMTTFGAAATRELASVSRQMRAAERDAESMTRRLERQIAVFGKAPDEIRRMDAATRAATASTLGLTDAGARLTAVSAELDRLQAAQSNAAKASGAHRSAMQGLSFQAQDAFTQISMGTNVLSVLAIQGGQAAGQMANLGGKIGAVANFMIGPWGLAITGGLLVLGALTKGMFDNEEAAKAAEKAMKSFQDRQSDIGNFIDATTGKLTEQNRTLVLNAMLTRQANIAANEKSISESRDKAFARAKEFALSVNYDDARNRDEVGGGRLTRDPAITAIINQAGGNVDKLVQGLTNLAKTRQDVRAVALDVSGIGGQAVLATRENEALRKELRALGGDTTALAKGTTALIERQVAVATATTPLAKARAQLALVQEGAAAADKAGGAALEEYRRSLTAATIAVNNADAAQKAATHSRTEANRAARRAESEMHRDATKAAREAAKAQRELEADFTSVIRQYDPARAAAAEYAMELEKIGKLRGAGLITAGDAVLYNSAAADLRQKQIEQAQRAKFSSIFGEGDPLGDLVSGIDRDRQADFERTMAARNEALRYQAELLDIIATNADRAGRGLADAFGEAGRSLGSLTSDFAGFIADQRRLNDLRAEQLRAAAQIPAAEERAQAERQANTTFALRSSALQIGAYGDMASAVKGFAKEGSTAYEAIAAAEKAFRVAQFAMSVAALAQNAAETFGFVANAGARATADGAAGIAAQAKLPWPLNLVAMGATAAALVAAGVAIVGSIGGGGGKSQPVTNTGTGTVLGDGKAQSESIKRSIDALREVDLLTNTYSRQMAASLKSIDSQIGGVAAQIARAGNIDASSGVTEGFKRNAIGNVLGAIPVIGGLLGSLFGSITTVTGSGLFARPQSVGSILGNGFDAQYYSDISKTSKFLGIKTGTKTSTQYAAADAGLEGQFTLLLRSFSQAIGAAAGPLGIATDDIAARVNGFVVNLGRIDTKGLTGTEISEKLSAVFGAAADGMAAAAVPGIERFQKVGEGAFETLVRVASTVESVSTALDLLGTAARALGIDAKLGVADQFDSLGDLTSAVDAYFEAYYTKEEQAAAKTAQLTRVMGSLGFSLPTSIAGFRQLVEAQDLTTAAGQAAYATLLQLAPAFADLQSAMEGAKSAADIAAERQDLQRQLLELQGNTAALRALDIAKLDVSNRALQEQIYAIQDAQEAAKAADELRQAWQSVGDSITEEIKRIRGLTTAGTGAGFVQLQGQFNAATAAARGGDQDAAKSLPGLSQSLLTAAAQIATSRQELARVQAQTAASLEATNASIARLAGGAGAASMSNAALIAAAATTQAASAPATAANDDVAAAVARLERTVDQMRTENNSGHAATAGNTGRMARKLDDVTTQSGGDAITTVAAA